MSTRRDYVATVGDTAWKVRALGEGTTSRPTVVMVAGLGSGDYLLPHARKLAINRRVLVPDMPGFGRSRGRQRLRTVDEFGVALLDFVEAEAGGSADLIGNSFGTQIVLAAAARRPTAARRVVLIGPTFDRCARSYPRVLARWLAISTKEPPSLGLSLARSYLQSGIRTPALAFRAGMNDRPEERIESVTSPLLIVRGSNDRIAPSAWVRDLQQRASCAEVAEVAEVSGVAHTVDYAAPERLAALVSAFLDRADHPQL
ncbi:MAG TPA: alpha/beta hydrolase [Mycobacteriales bacterium]|nr:alpha/beta hydrolase [Mycobacteriales bacterium]